jgi:hypothetical protein
VSADRTGAAGEKLPDWVDEELLEVALERAIQAQMFEPSLKGMIRRLVFDPDDRWRVCCGNECYVCMIPLARAVDDVRAEIGWPG